MSCYFALLELGHHGPLTSITYLRPEYQNRLQPVYLAVPYDKQTFNMKKLESKLSTLPIFIIVPVAVKCGPIVADAARKDTEIEKQHRKDYRFPGSENLAAGDTGPKFLLLKKKANSFRFKCPSAKK